MAIERFWGSVLNCGESGLAGEVPTQGLVAYWRLNEDLADPVANDSHGSFNGTLTSTAIRTADGKFGNAIEYDGAGYVDLGTAINLLGITTDFTLVAWVYRPEGVNAALYVIDLGMTLDGTAANNRGTYLVVHPSIGNLTFRIEDNTLADVGGGATQGRMTTTIDVKEGEWNLVVCDRSNSEAHAYIYSSDGVASEEVAFNGTAFTQWDSRSNSLGRFNNEPFGSTPSPAGGVKQSSTFVYNRVLSRPEREGIWSGGVGVDL